MCGRFTLIRPADVLRKLTWIAHPPPDLAARYNIAPTQPVLSVLNNPSDRFDYLSWGLVPSWAKEPSIANKMINARAETLTDKPAFQKALRRRRCLILADGFYGWTMESAPGASKPMYVQMKDHLPFALGGLWEDWASPDGNGTEVMSCTIITTRPNALMDSFQDRMPVIIPPDCYLDWLDRDEKRPAELEAYWQPYPADEMEARPISTYVNSAKNEGPKCIESPAEETPC
jgi:putative SOS response-associated peptidase YedK